MTHILIVEDDTRLARLLQEYLSVADSAQAALDRIGEHPKAYVIDFSTVPVIDSTGAATIEGIVRKAHRRGVPVYIAGHVSRSGERF